jgi:4'-phosphopantetheinyl transferase
MTGPAVGWIGGSIADVPGHDDWLSARERATLDQLRFMSRRRDWRLGRWTAKQAVRAWLETTGGAAPRPLDSLEIVAAEDGAPDVHVRGRVLPVAISLSHRDGTAVCVVADGGTEIGCDLEAIEPRSDVFISDWFTPEERAVVDRARPGERPLVTNLIWSGKESVLKALREGLRLDTRAVVVHLHAARQDGTQEQWSPFSAVAVDGGRRFDGRWRTYCGHVLTAVVPSPWSGEPHALALLQEG